MKMDNSERFSLGFWFAICGMSTLVLIVYFFGENIIPYCVTGSLIYGLIRLGWEIRKVNMENRKG